MTNLSLLTESMITRAKELGADLVKASASRSEVREFNVDGGRFSLFRTLFNQSVSITVFKGGRKGSASVNRFDEEAVNKVIADALAAADSSQPDEAWDLCHEPNSYDITDGCPIADTDLLFTRTEELKNTIAKDYPKVLLEQMIVDHSGFEAVTRTSYGAHFKRRGGSYQVSLMFSAHEGEKASSFMGAGFTTDSLDTPFIELADTRRALADIEKQIDTEAIEGKFVGTMVLTPDSLGEFFGSALSNFTSDISIIDGTSIWKNALGTKVADERLTIGMNPRDPRIVGGSYATGEGFMAENYNVIENGILKTFMLSLYAANKTGHTRAPNDGFDMIIEGGDTPYDEMIASIDKGIIVGRFSGGAPNAKGDFSGVAKNSFLVENGKITKALRETMINGNLADLFTSIISISKETTVNGGSVLPSISFSGITVSGK
ncbi:MAG: TldD/PmbA family protein [Clostridia bacterium]|nr:TldD/PmbA family protein [Clostridia bacterium]